MTVVYVKPSHRRCLKTYSATSVLCSHQRVKFFDGQPISVPPIRPTLFTPLAPVFNDLTTLGGVPSFRLKATTILACRMPALGSLLMETEGIERFGLVTDVTDLH